MNQKEIQELIRFVSKSGVSEVSISQEGFSITIKTQSDDEKDVINKMRTMQPMMMSQPQMSYNVPMSVAPSAPAPSNTVTQSSPEAPSAPVNTDAGLLTIKSPMIGTMYRRPSPDKELFVKVGDTVAKGQVVCIIEAMKLFNEIESEVSGTIVKILVDDSSPVEYDQPLFLVQP